MTVKWVSQISAPRPDRPVLVIFPHAGSGAAPYQRWRTAAPLNVEVLAVRSPGREARMREPLVSDLDTLVEALAQGLGEVLDGRRFGFFGHSIGSLIAFELARWLRGRNQPGPLCLGCSGYPAPQIRIPQPLHKESDDTILRLLRDSSYLPDRLFSQSGFVEMFLPILRADFALTEGYRLRDEPPLPCPIYAFGGDADPFATPEEVEGWRQFTHMDSSMDLFPGNHLYLFDYGTEILANVTRPLL